MDLWLICDLTLGFVNLCNICPESLQTNNTQVNYWSSSTSKSQNDNIILEKSRF